MKRTLLASLLILLATFTTATAQKYDDLVKVSVLDGWRTDKGTHVAAFKVTLKQGWKTYWRSPGEAGIPPRFSWAGSRNLKAVAVHWPVPSIYQAYGLRTIGYADSVVIPVELTPKLHGKPIALKTRIEIGICEEICIPVNLTLRARLGAGGLTDPAITAALRSRPLTAAEAGAGRVTCKLSPIQDGYRLEARLDVPRTGKTEATVIELPDQPVWVSEPVMTRQGRTLIATADIMPTTSDAFFLDRSALRFTVIGSRKAIDIQGCSGG